MSAVFADTFYFLALLRRDDPAHARALAEARLRREVLTTEFILLELGNACARAKDHGDFVELLSSLQASPRITVISLDSQLLARGLKLFDQRRDKDWSLTDCISFVVMQDEEIHEALTGDQHFEQAGFVALLK